MKYYLPLLILFFLTVTVSAQVSEIHFAYDESGNRISRSIGQKENVYENSAEEPKMNEKSFESDDNPSVKTGVSDTDSTTKNEKRDDELSREVQVYPNPTKGEVIVGLGHLDIDNTALKIIRLSGELIYHNPAPENMNRIDLSAEPPGMYIIQITNDDITYEWKIIKH